MTLTTDELQEANAELEKRSATERVQWALDRFGDSLVLSTSFGIQSAVMLHLVSSVHREIPVIFIDTGYLFEETYRFADQLQSRLNLNLKVYQAQMSPARQEALFGKRWEQGEAGLVEYNRMNKVEPMNRALKELGAQAWLTGLRHEQSDSRGHLDYLARQNLTYKVHPILEWSSRDVYRYLTENNLPYHPLWEEGYVSVGDWHSSRPLEAGMSEQETRFNGLRRECGLHELSGDQDFQI